MKKLVGSLVLVLLLVAMLVGSASADSPHFIRSDASITNAGDLVATFKEAGLGNTTTTEVITLAADATAVYACINGGGNHPQAANKETVSQALSTSGSFPVRNGQTTGSLTLTPPGPGDFACPPGQRMVLSSVSYTNVTLTGVQGDVANVPGTFSTVLYPI